MPAYLFVEDVLRPYLRTPMWLSTAKAYRKSAEVLEHFFGGMWCTDSQRTKRRTIDGVKVAAFREWRKTAYGVSPVTVARDIALACRACNWGIREQNYLFTNPFIGRAVAERDRGAFDRERRIYSPEEARAIMAHLEPDFARVWRFILLSGFRVSEALQLTRDRVSQDGRVTFAPRQQKSGRAGVRVLSPAALALLDADGVWAFTRGGKPISQDTFGRHFRKARERAGIAGCIRDGRTTAGQWALDAGATLDEVQAMLGHESRATTEGFYVRPTPQLARNAVNRICF